MTCDSKPILWTRQSKKECDWVVVFRCWECELTLTQQACVSVKLKTVSWDAVGGDGGRALCCYTIQASLSVASCQYLDITHTHSTLPVAGDKCTLFKQQHCNRCTLCPFTGLLRHTHAFLYKLKALSITLMLILYIGLQRWCFRTCCTKLHIQTMGLVL